MRRSTLAVGAILGQGLLITLAMPVAHSIPFHVRTLVLALVAEETSLALALALVCALAMSKADVALLVLSTG